MVNFLATETLRIFSVKLLSKQLTLLRNAAWVYSFPGAGFCTLLVELYKVHVDSILQTLEVPLNGSTTLWSISHFSQFSVCIVGGGALYLNIQVIHEAVEQYWL